MGLNDMHVHVNYCITALMWMGDKTDIQPVKTTLHQQSPEVVWKTVQ